MVLLHLLMTISGQRTNLQELFNNMERIRIIEFSNLHAITATLEAIVTYSVSKNRFWSCQNDQLISWFRFS